jgi:hypothetical protein
MSVRGHSAPHVSRVCSHGISSLAGPTGTGRFDCAGGRGCAPDSFPHLQDLLVLGAQCRDKLGLRQSHQIQPRSTARGGRLRTPLNACSNACIRDSHTERRGIICAAGGYLRRVRILQLPVPNFLVSIQDRSVPSRCHVEGVGVSTVVTWAAHRSWASEAFFCISTDSSSSSFETSTCIVGQRRARDGSTFEGIVNAVNWGAVPCVCTCVD